MAIVDDEVKFVIGNRKDFDWSKNIIEQYKLNEKCELLMSPTHGQIDPKSLVNWILEINLPVRMQLQMHKIIYYLF